MKKKGQAIRSRKLEIENPSARSMEQKGFDDMVAITLGDKGKVYTSQSSSVSIVNEKNTGSFYDLIQKEDGERKKLLLILGIIAIVCITIILITVKLIEYHREQTDGKISVNYSSSDFKGEDYKKVIEQLEKQGFTNIVTEPIEDLITGWITSDGEVEEVEIDGYTSFSSKSRYLPNVKIVIRYHTFSD